MKNYTGLVLYSGGLDSFIAAHLLKTLGYNIILISFKSHFFRKNTIEGVHKKVIGEFEFDNYVYDVSDEFIEVLKKPSFGYGKNLNPCIDCKIFMLKKAKQLMKEFKADFIATGEVLDQRPKSQKMYGLQNILKQADVKDVLVRPLSIRYLRPNALEEKGIIDRNEIIDIIQIHGRSRTKQIDYAKKHNMTGYSTPSGGCLLTHSEYCRKLKILFDYNINDSLEFDLLTFGRNFNISHPYGYKKLIVGKDEKINNELSEIPEGIKIFVKDFKYPGPISLLIADFDNLTEQELNIIGNIHLHYSDARNTDGEHEITFQLENTQKNVKIDFIYENAKVIVEKYRL